MSIDASTVGFCMIGIFVHRGRFAVARRGAPMPHCGSVEVRRVDVRIRTVWSVWATSAMCHVCVMCPYIDFLLGSWSLGQVLCGVASPSLGEGGEAHRSSAENSDLHTYEG